MNFFIKPPYFPAQCVQKKPSWMETVPIWQHWSNRYLRKKKMTSKLYSTACVRRWLYACRDLKCPLTDLSVWHRIFFKSNILLQTEKKHRDTNNCVFWETAATAVKHPRGQERLRVFQDVKELAVQTDPSTAERDGVSTLIQTGSLLFFKTRYILVDSTPAVRETSNPSLLFEWCP